MLTRLAQDTATGSEGREGRAHGTGRLPGVLTGTQQQGTAMGPRYRDALEEPGEEPEDFDLPSPDPVEDLGPLPDEPYRTGEAPPPACDADDDVSF